VLNVFQGEFSGEADAEGIYDFVAAGDQALADRVLAEIKTAITDIEAISGDNNMPFRVAISDEQARVRIQTSVDSLAVLQASLETDVVALLGTWSGK